VAVVGCSSPSSNNLTRTTPARASAAGEDGRPGRQGPAPEVPGAKKGGTLTVYSQSTPNTFDPTDIYYVDSNEISKLMIRTPRSSRSATASRFWFRT
jgi:peptide/nickel transport system substrate-binding protein